MTPATINSIPLLELPILWGPNSYIIHLCYLHTPAVLSVSPTLSLTHSFSLSLSLSLALLIALLLSLSFSLSLSLALSLALSLTHTSVVKQ